MIVDLVNREIELSLIPIHSPIDNDIKLKMSHSFMACFALNLSES